MIMEKLNEIIDRFLNFFYTSNLSMFDIFTITILNILVFEYSVWFCIGYIPFIWYSTKQKIKYDILNGK